MIIYKITNQVNGKVYIGQTIHTLAHRKNRHLECVVAGVDSHLYNAMRKYGVDQFVFEEIDHADTLQDLNYLECYYITKYDSVRSGYNMGYGGDNNVMFTDEIKQKHDQIMKSPEVRNKISQSMKQYRKEHPFSEEHRRKLSESQKGRKYDAERRKKCASRSIGCYCVLEDGQELHFSSYRDAYKWWVTIDNPFNSNAECIFQHKIKQSIKDGYFTYGPHSNIHYEFPRWYREEVVK